MLRLKIIIVIIFIAGALFSCSSIKRLSNRPIGLINNVSYKDSSFDNPNASNGFLVEYENRVYGVTAKHILIMAKTDKMKFVDFEGELKQWKMHPKNDSKNYVILDKLLSTNRKDSLTWSYLDTNWDAFNDWLVFSVKENKTSHKPLKFRKKPLKKDENVYVIGWSYKDSIGPQRLYTYKFNEIEGNYYNLKQIEGPKSLGGLSGSPVVDKNGRVVALVSSGWEDEKTKEVFIQATSIKNTIEFISNLN
ncbi:trypsin-like peptidase domain-containing protein [uncultured Aquimarina sp.]|uniref:trypsin-like peptidase domain-containing protein n=1 Tax=uncultured Aquimarina sp. TaxID=575652 RepID=UPI00260FF4EF|nr:trypsin-like peptidase domain-containing protein [uncultured Aquimarina sp.]